MEKLKRPGFHKLVFYIFVINSTSKENKQIPEHP